MVLDSVCAERLTVTEPQVWANTYNGWGGVALIAWQPLPAGSGEMMTFGSIPDYCLPATPDPAALAYYDRFAGMIFWAIYNETSENSAVDHLDIVDAAVSSADPNDENRVIAVPSGNDFANSHRSIRYMMARAILQNVPSYESVIDDLSNGYGAGYSYGLARWQGSLNDPTDDLWLGFDGENCRQRNLPSYSVAKSRGPESALDWLSDFAQCKHFRDNIQNIHSVIDAAIDDHLRGIPSPVTSSYYIRNANTCFWFDEGGSCELMRDIPARCQTDNCQLAGVYTEGTRFDDIHVTLSDWLDHYPLAWIGEYDPMLDPTMGRQDNPYFLFDTDPEIVGGVPTNKTDQVLVYNTQIETQYYVSIGCRIVDGQCQQYFLMGIGRAYNYADETTEDTFQRHWTRLNRDRNPAYSPEAYRPGTCVVALAHVTFGDGIFSQWSTYTFQHQNQQPVTDAWFCPDVLEIAP